MNFDILYSIALDLIDKKNSNGSGIGFKPKYYVCVLITEKNSIFTGISGSDIKNGKLVSICAEYETIKIMLGSNESRIKAITVVDAYTLLPCVPCIECQNLILSVNANNVDCLVMQPNKQFTPLSDIYSSSNILNEDYQWNDGWDTQSVPTPVTDMSTLQTSNSMFSPNVAEEKKPIVFNSEQTIQSLHTFQAMPTKQVKPLSNGFSAIPVSRGSSRNSIESSMYLNNSNPIPQAPVSSGRGTFSAYNANSSTFKAEPISSFKTTFSKSMETTTQSSLFKERLNGIISTNYKVEEKAEIFNKDFQRPEPKYSIKELKALAKEKKRLAKRDIKLVEEANTHNKT